MCIQLRYIRYIRVHESSEKQGCVGSIERLDEGHLYPLGNRRDKYVTGGARTPCTCRRTLYLKSFLDSLLLAIRNLYLGRNGRPPQICYSYHPTPFTAGK